MDIDQDILTAFDEALCCSVDWSKEPREFTLSEDKRRDGNSIRSSRFVSDACDKLNDLINPCEDNQRQYTMRKINVDGAAFRESGEWLLDGIWTKDTRIDTLVDGDREGSNFETPFQVHCAFESESSPKGEDFFVDFSKVVVVSAKIKIFAAGLNQTSEGGVERYIERRSAQAAKLLNCASDSHTCKWYLAFWPSPTGTTVERPSLWDHLEEEDYQHLNCVRLYVYQDKSFKRVESTP